jgi:dipeptidyl aminopeptidase/acylaminoacyl peptidase
MVQDGGRNRSLNPRPVPDLGNALMHRWTRDSPITYVEQMNKPMFILHGENDPRVKKEESERIVEKLKEKDVHVEYLFFDDEGHGFSKKENEMDANKRIRYFLDNVID